MLETGQMNRNSVEMVNIDMLVPKDHLLRKIDAAIDFTKIYEFVKDLYSEDIGRPSIDPVVLFKIVLIQHIYGIPSLRRTLEDIQMNLAYRWFLGYGITETIPHFSTVSYNFKHRFTSSTIEYVFRWILKEAAEAAGMRKPSSGQVYQLDMSGGDRAVAYDKEEPGLLRRLLTALNHSVYAVVEYFE